MSDSSIRSRRVFLQTITMAGTALVACCPAETPEESPETERQRSSPAGPVPEGETIGLRKVAGGLVAPVQFQEPAGGSDRQFVADQVGIVHVLTADGVRDEPFLDLRDELVDLGENLPEWAVNEERGLLGLAFHPNYDENRRFYVRYSAPGDASASEEYSHTEVLSEFRTGSDSRSADRDSERRILEIPSPLPIHQAGTISFGPDGYLYVTMGDGGQPSSAQDTSENLLGGILRIDVDTSGQDRPYSVPDANPLVGSEGRDEFFAWGFRNPWRISFNKSDLYAGDVGSELYEEINLVRKGENHGWPVKEGPQCVELENAVAQPVECPEETSAGVEVGSLRDPTIHYPHSEDGEIIGIAVIGGYVYRADTLPALTGTFVFGDYSSAYEEPNGTLFAAEPSGTDGWRMTELTVANAEDDDFDRSILSLGRGRDGELYVLTSTLPPSEAADLTPQSGEVYEIVPPAQTETTIGRPTDTP